MRRAVLSLLLLAGIGLSALPAPASASPAPTASAPSVGVPLYPAEDPAAIPPGFAVSPGRAVEVAKTSPRIQAIHRVRHPLQYQVFVWTGTRYEVYFAYRGKIIADVLVGPRGQLGPTYEGVQIFATYARGGYSSVFDSAWLLGPFTAMFVLPLILLRRRSWLDVLDLGAVLSFGVSYGLFDAGHLELAVWLAYPPLLYLLGRMLRRGFRGARSSSVLDVRLGTGVLVAGLLVLVAARIAVTLIPSSVVDVGEASVIGAYKIVHGQPIYFSGAGHPDTYGPIMYLAYVPFQLLFPGDTWAYVPGARAAAIAFDLLTIGALGLLGSRLRPGREGRRLGLLMAWLWAACPATVLGIVKGTNDGLVALLVVLVILALSAPGRRGAVLALATAAKFFPVLLLPLVAVGRGSEDRRSLAKLLGAFALVCAAAVLLFLPPGGLKEMWDHTLGYQLSRPDIFSPWALHPGLAPVKDALELAVAILAVLVAVRPRGSRSTAQVSALAAALIIAVQLPALHWFYFYVVWFFPLVLVAVLGAPSAEAPRRPELRLARPEPLPSIEPPVELIGAA